MAYTNFIQFNFRTSDIIHSLKKQIMKNIINHALRFLLVPILLLSFNACENEVIEEVQHLENRVFIEYSSEYKARTTGVHLQDLDGQDLRGKDDPINIGIIGPPDDCPHEDCDTAIPAMGAILQQAANAQCREVWSCIACCMDGGIAYVTMYALPQTPPCDIVAEYDYDVM